MAQRINADIIHEGFMAAAAVGLPVLLTLAVIGLVFAVLQAITQIQDQTLPQVLKFFATCVILLLAGATLSAPLVAFSIRAFELAGLQ